MSSRQRTSQEVEQFYGAINAIFEDVILPTIGNDISKLLRYSMMLKPWNAGQTFAKDEYFRWGVDANGFPMVYKSKNNHVAQIGILPNGAESANLYELVGYDENGVRHWSEPYGSNSSYDLDEIVPKHVSLTHAAKTYTQGEGATQGEYVISPEGDVYTVVPPSIVMNIEFVPFTEATVYAPVANAVVVSPTEITIDGLAYYKSLKNDNRFDPESNTVVWEIYTP